MAEYYIDGETGAAVRSELFEKWKSQLRGADGLLLQGITGSGKTMLVRAFLKKEYADYRMVSCREDWRQTVLDYLDQVHDGRLRRIVVLDDFQELVMDKHMLQEVLELFWHSRSGNGRCKFMFLSRGRFPKELTELLHERIVYAASELMLDSEQIRLLFIREGIAPEPEKVEECRNHSQGWPWFVQIWIHYLSLGVADPQELHERTTQDIDTALDTIFQDTVMAPMFEKLVRLSVFDSFKAEMAEFLLGEGEGKKMERMLSMGTSSMNYRADGTIQLHRFFLRYLRSRFFRLPKEEQKLFCEKAAGFYEKRRDIVQAVRCYYGAGNITKITELTIVLAENADGCIFAEEGSRYIDILPEEAVRSNPDLIAARAMLASYRMQEAESNEWVKKLHHYVQQNPENESALRSYLRLRIALPHGRAETVLDKFQDCVDAFGWENAVVRNVTPSGDMPSVLNGGIDFSCFLLDTEKNYRRLKQLAVPVLGVEAQGWAEIFRGEAAYQRDDRTAAIAALTQGLSDADLRGNPRMQYAATGNIARLFLAEGQPDTAVSFLKNMRIKAAEAGFFELLPNISCSEVLCSLRMGDFKTAREFLNSFEQLNKKQFLISERYQVYTAACVCLALGKEEEALRWLTMLQKLAEQYHRSYLLWKVKLLMAAANHRMGKEWKKLVKDTAGQLEPYGMVRLAADEGAALLPLWQEAAPDTPFGEKTAQAMASYAALYPSYLNKEEEAQSLTIQERRVLGYLAEGLTNVQIAGELGFSVSTVKKEISVIFAKLGVNNRVGAVKKGYLRKLI